MWVNPNHPTPPRQAKPPQEQGQRLGTFPRGPGVELRVCLDEYEGHQYFALRVWERGQDGAWWPTKKGVSVRLSKAHDLARVLAEAARDSFKASNRGRGRPTGVLDQLPAVARTPAQQEFNEFAGA